MAIATGADVRVSPMRLCDVLSLYVDPKFRGHGWERALSELWGKWGICKSCNITIAPAAEVLWSGEKEGFVHAGHIRNGDAVPWDEVFLPGHSKGCSVAERLKLKGEEREQRKAQAVA